MSSWASVGNVPHMHGQPDETASINDATRDTDGNNVLGLGEAGLAIWDYELATGRVSLSDIWGVLLGGERRPTSTTIQALTEIVPAEDRPMVREAIIKAVKGRGFSKYQATHRVKRPDGEITWILSEGMVIERDRNGRALRMLGTNRDITARITAQHAFYESRNWFDVLIQHTPVAIALFDRDMRYLAASQQWIRYYNLPNQHIIGEFYYDLSPDIANRWKDRHTRALAGNTIHANEERIEGADGTIRWMKWEIVPWRQPDGQVGGIAVFTEDITKQKQSELAVKADMEAMTRLKELSDLFILEEAFENILLSIVDAAMSITNADFGNIQLLDRETGHLRVLAQRGLPSWWLDFSNAEGKGQGACAAALAQGKRVIVDDVEHSPLLVGTPALNMQLRAGVRAVQATPLRSRTGTPLGILSTHYKTSRRPDEQSITLLDLLARQAADIIDRVQLEQSIRQLSREIEALHQRQVALQTASAFAHELNQPLSAIANYCAAAQNFLNRQPPDINHARDTVTKSEMQAVRAGDSIRELLALLELDKVAIEPFNLNDEIETVLAIARSEHELKFRVRLSLAKDLSQVLANRIHVRKVMLNLVNNGVEAMQGAGVPLPAIVVLVHTKRDQNVAMVTVRDQGPGFPRDHVNKLFEPFFTTKPRGIGLGLSISRSLIEANGGQLWVDPEGGPGAAVHFTVPLAV